MRRLVSLGVIVLEIHLETVDFRNGGLDWLTQVSGNLSVLAREG